MVTAEAAVALPIVWLGCTLTGKKQEPSAFGQRAAMPSRPAIPALYGLNGLSGHVEHRTRGCNSERPDGAGYGEGRVCPALPPEYRPAIHTPTCTGTLRKLQHHLADASAPAPAGLFQRLRL